MFVRRFIVVVIVVVVVVFGIIICHRGGLFFPLSVCVCDSLLFIVGWLGLMALDLCHVVFDGIGFICTIVLEC